jgi:uncharacterized membrane protein
MKWSLKREILPLGIMLILLALSLYFYPSLPNVVPSHFNSQGQPDDQMAKLPFLLIFWGILLSLYFILTFIPRIDPFWKKIQPKYGIFLLFRDFCMLFFLFIFFLAIYGAQTGKFPMQAMNIGMGLLFLLLGIWMPRLPRNFFFGIRTPWTLASDEVWKKSHIVGGWLFGAGGIVLMILALVGLKDPVALIIVLIPVVLISAIIYPLFLYRRLQKEGKLAAPEL